MARVSLRWLGHAAFVITSPEGKTVFIDPWITDNPSCPIKVEDIEAADIVLVSHDHFDHTGSAGEIIRKTGALLVAAPETAARFQCDTGIASENVAFGGFGMNIGGSIEVKGITITMTEAFHSSQTACPVGYVIRLENGVTLYHAGDTGIFESMRLLGQLYPLDVALLPIGGAFTMDAYQASKALTLLKPKRAIPMHYGTFPVLEQDAHRFVELARQEAPEVQVIVLKPGQEYVLE